MRFTTPASNCIGAGSQSGAPDVLMESLLGVWSKFFRSSPSSPSNIHFLCTALDFVSLGNSHLSSRDEIIILQDLICLNFSSGDRENLDKSKLVFSDITCDLLLLFLCHCNNFVFASKLLASTMRAKRTRQAILKRYNAVLPVTKFSSLAKL